MYYPLLAYLFTVWGIFVVLPSFRITLFPPFDCSTQIHTLFSSVTSLKWFAVFSILIDFLLWLQSLSNENFCHPGLCIVPSGQNITLVGFTCGQYFCFCGPCVCVSITSHHILQMRVKIFSIHLIYLFVHFHCFYSFLPYFFVLVSITMYCQ